MQLPRWLRIVGALECVLGVWGIYAAIVTLAGAARRVPTACVVLVMIAIVMLSITGGFLLVRGERRGIRPLLWALGPQLFRVSIPGMVWLVSLGWSLTVVLYQGNDGTVPEPRDLATWIGHHPYSTYFALDAVAIPCF